MDGSTNSRQAADNMSERAYLSAKFQSSRQQGVREFSIGEGLPPIDERMKEEEEEEEEGAEAVGVLVCRQSEAAAAT